MIDLLFDEIRYQYDVPAMRGVLVKFRGEWGVITGVSNGRLIVKPDVAKPKSLRWKCHPTWELEYFPKPRQLKTCQKRRNLYAKDKRYAE